MIDNGRNDPHAMRARVLDGALAAFSVALAVAAFALDWGEGGSDPNAVDYAVAVVAGGSVFWRRRHPIGVLAVVVAARVFVAWHAGNEVALLPAAMIALFTVARTGDRRTSLAAAGTASLVMMTVVAALDAESFLPEFLTEGAILLLPIAVGDAARSRADRLRDLIDTEANSRVQAERIRIARDLHDVVAHGLSTIAIQSGVAAHLVDRDHDQAKEALEIINATSKRSLEELRAMVGVLRSTDDAPLAPTPTDPNDLGDLVGVAANAGIALTTDVVGTFPADVGDHTVVAVHRIIQEALTNVGRHAGSVPTHIAIRHSGDHVEVQVTNQPGTRSSAAVQSTGVGIVGMAERAESLGGTLTAEPTGDGGFEVIANLPYARRKP